MNSPKKSTTLAAKKKTKKRRWDDRIPEWDEYFLEIAKQVSTKSKDATQVGAVLVSPDKLIVSTGYNGLARGIEDLRELLDIYNREETYRLICHAEFNAIINAARSGISLKGSAIYVNKFPCLACSNAIVQAGITRIYTDDSRYWMKDPLEQDHRYGERNKRTQIVLKQGGVRVDAPNHPDFAFLLTEARNDKSAQSNGVERRGPSKGNGSRRATANGTSRRKKPSKHSKSVSRAPH
jgi:dCMP deaminase